jgi:hypothetical protein
MIQRSLRRIETDEAEGWDHSPQKNRRMDQVALKTPRDLLPLKEFVEPLRAVLAARVRKPLPTRLHNLSLAGGVIAANNGSTP